MEIHVARNGEKFGPYSPDQVRMWLTAGRLNGDDLAWYNGLAQWMPLATVISALPVGSVPPSTLAPPKKSGLAKASFIIAIFATFVWAGDLIYGFSMIYNIDDPSFKDNQSGMRLVGVIILVLSILNLAGFIFGLIAIGTSISNKWISIAGTIVNGIELALAGLIIYFASVGFFCG